MQKNELNEQLKENINSWRDERSKEEDELRRLKEKQSKRKEIRAEQEKELARKKREEEELVEEECRISLNIRLKPLQLDAMDSDELRNKARKIWESIVTLETDKYDYEQRKLDQEYEMKELHERQ